jgi:hypothetical protein
VLALPAPCAGLVLRRHRLPSRRGPWPLPSKTIHVSIPTSDRRRFVVVQR